MPQSPLPPLFHPSLPSVLASVEVFSENTDLVGTPVPAMLVTAPNRLPATCPTAAATCDAYTCTAGTKKASPESITGGRLHMLRWWAQQS